MKRDSLVVQWLELSASTPRAQVQSLLEELRSLKHTLCAKKKNSEKTSQKLDILITIYNQ